MGKHTLEGAHHAAQSGSQSEEQTKKRRKVSKHERQSSTNGVEPSAELLKKERKERKRVEKLRKGEQSPAKASVEPKDGSDTLSGGNAAGQAANGTQDSETLQDRQTAKIGSSTAPSKRVKDRDVHIENGNSPTEPTATSETRSGQSHSGYSEHAALTALASSVIDQYLTSNFISVEDPLRPTDNLRPITDFSYLPVTDSKDRAPFEAFSSPTPIQAAAWPYLLSGRDVIGVAETGSGKTFAFGFPLIRRICPSSKGKKSRGIKAVIVSPTRELALQTYEQILSLASPAGLKAVCVYGGVSKDEQRKALKTANIVVATPGRLKDFIQDGAADLGSVSYLVLDEADRMLDKGFEEDIKLIIGKTPSRDNRQTLMFTATWPQSVRDLAATFMTSPVRISIGDNAMGELRANNRITQKVEVIDPRQKETRLVQLIKERQSGGGKDDRILIFCLYKKEATRIENHLRYKGFRVAGIHGDLSQQQRTTSLEAFKSAKVTLLVATDVAARGLDIPAVRLVVNVTFPLTAEDYVHRIGRTGRAGKEGAAITLFTEHDKGLAGALINVLKAANQPVPDDLLKFGTTVKKKGHEAYGAFYKETNDSGKAATKIKFDD